MQKNRKSIFSSKHETVLTSQSIYKENPEKSRKRIFPQKDQVSNKPIVPIYLDEIQTFKPLNDQLHILLTKTINQQQLQQNSCCTSSNLYKQNSRQLQILRDCFEIKSVQDFKKNKKSIQNEKQQHAGCCCYCCCCIECYPQYSCKRSGQKKKKSSDYMCQFIFMNVICCLCFCINRLCIECSQKVGGTKTLAGKLNKIYQKYQRRVTALKK